MTLFSLVFQCDSWQQQAALPQLGMEKLAKQNKQYSRKCCSGCYTVCKHLKFLQVYCLCGLLKAQVPNEDL